MWHHFDIIINRNIEVEHSNYYSPFVNELRCREFFFTFIPDMLKGREFAIDMEQLHHLLDEVKEVKSDVARLTEFVDRNANVIYTREKLLERLCNNLKIQFRKDELSRRFIMAIIRPKF